MSESRKYAGLSDAQVLESRFTGTIFLPRRKKRLGGDSFLKNSETR